MSGCVRTLRLDRGRGCRRAPITAGPGDADRDCGVASPRSEDDRHRARSWCEPRGRCRESPQLCCGTSILASRAEGHLGGPVSAGYVYASMHAWSEPPLVEVEPGNAAARHLVTPPTQTDMTVTA